jgi:hypothetical protein
VENVGKEGTFDVVVDMDDIDCDNKGVSTVTDGETDDDEADDDGDDDDEAITDPGDDINGVDVDGGAPQVH